MRAIRNRNRNRGVVAGRIWTFVLSTGLVPVLALAVVVAGCTEDDAGRSLSGTQPAGTANDQTRLRTIFEMPDRLDRVEALVAALRAMSPEDLEQLRELLGDRDLPVRDLERTLVISAWADHDPEAATAWAVRSERGDSKNAAITDAVREWARRDPEAVIREYDINLLAPKHPGILVGLIEGWFETGDIALLEAYVQDLGDSDSRQRAVSTLARLRVSRDGPEAAIRWAEAIPATQARFKTSAYRRVAREIARTQPRMAADWCDRVCDSPYGDSVAELIVREWAGSDGPAAMEWLLTRPDGMDTQVAVRAAYRAFMIADAEAALAWMEGTTEGQRHDNRLQGAVGMYVNKRSWEPGRADTSIEWAGYLKNEAERELALISIVRRWRDRDEEAAEAWLADSPLPEEARQRAREPLRRIGGGRQG